MFRNKLYFGGRERKQNLPVVQSKNQLNQSIIQLDMLIYQKIFDILAYASILGIFTFYNCSIITLQQNNKMISPYKTPISIHIDSKKRMKQKTNKYKLPFPNDLPIRNQIQPVDRLQNKSIINSQLVNSDAESFNQKASNIDKNSKKSGIQQDEVQIQYSVQNKQQHYIKDDLKIYSLPKINQEQSNFQTISLQQNFNVQKESHETQTQNYETSKKQKQQNIHRIESKLSIDRTHQFKLQPIQPKKLPSERKTTQNRKYAQRRLKYYSSRNRYADSQNLADISQQSNVNSAKSLNRKQKDMPQQLKSKRLINRKPILHESMKKMQKQVWQILLSYAQQQQIDQYYKNDKKSNSKIKRRKRKLTQSQQINKSQIFVQKSLNLNQRQNLQQSINFNDNMYNQLPNIQQNAVKFQISNNQSDPIIKRLQSMMIELKQTSKKRKINIPLQKYMQQYQMISKVNPFFKKLNQFGGCLLLSIGKLIFLDSSDLIFTQGQPITQLSIIILGKVLLTKSYNSFKYYCMSGESLGQQALFDQNKPYNIRIFNNSKSVEYKTQAKSINRVCILRISLRKFYKLSIQLNSVGEKRLFNLIDNLFRINYLKKNAIIHHQLKEKLQTQILARQKAKISFYFN